MPEVSMSIAWLAFWMGIVSAVSLPLGALTIRFWQPSSRMIAWLMAFGAGALLFALTIDLFAPAIAKGLYWQVSLGAVMGSLIYLYLNQHLNAWGGFLRKKGTTLQFMQHRKKRRQIAFLTSINRLSFLKTLSQEDKLKLLSFIEIETLQPRTLIYQQGDLHDAFYVIHSGVVRLQDPQRQLQTFIELDDSDVFGRMAFFTRQPNATQAVVKETTEVWKIRRDAFNRFLESSPAALSAFIEYYQASISEFENSLPRESAWNAEMLNYLAQRHAMPIDRAERHLQSIQQHIQHSHQLGRTLRTQVSKPLPTELFMQAFKQVGGKQLSPSVQEAIVKRFHYRQRQAGEGVYKNHSLGDYWFLMDYGEVELFLPQEKLEQPARVSAQTFFGSRAFLLGGLRLSTALAKTSIGYWQVSRKDFECLMLHYPEIRKQLKRLIQSEKVFSYLKKDIKLSKMAILQWQKQANKSLAAGQLPDLANRNVRLMHPVAPYVAIWLGIFLDGIPESLTIGAHLSNHGFLSLSLIAGLFLSNYPEALSSSASMRAQGISHTKIFLSWFSLMLLTGIGAAVGSVVFSGASQAQIAIISGIAAGAMLSVIAETMLPESYAKAGSVVGFVTLVGFLAALMFKTLDV